MQRTASLPIQLAWAAWADDVLARNDCYPGYHDCLMFGTAVNWVPGHYDARACREAVSTSARRSHIHNSLKADHLQPPGGQAWAGSGIGRPGAGSPAGLKVESLYSVFMLILRRVPGGLGVKVARRDHLGIHDRIPGGN